MMRSSILKIVKKYLSGRFPSETEEKIQRWLIKDDNEKDKEVASLEYWNSIETISELETYSALGRVNRRIGYLQKETIRVPLFRKLSKVAAFLILLFAIAGGYIYYQFFQNQMIEIYVAYGTEKHLFLPDSSEIWINAGSTIKYPREFNGEKRIVHLNGEAFFSVKRNELKPFVVNTEKLSVNVLGTKFNIKAYSNEEQITTTLTNGKIEVKSEEFSYILKPNEQFNFNKKTSSVNISEIPSNETDAWRSGRLIFVNSSFPNILQTLERHFNVSFNISNMNISINKKYTVKFKQKEDLDDILIVLKEIIGFTYQKKSNEIVIYNLNN